MSTFPSIPFEGLKHGCRVTVFGGSGFVGRHLVRLLAKRGAHVRVGIRDIDAALFLKPSGDVGQIVPLQVDISNPSEVATAVKNTDVVVNLVGILFERGQRTFQRLHVEGAANVAQAAANAGASRLLHLSALGADENSPSIYGRTKKAGEDAVKAVFPGATIFRPSVIYGPEDDFFNKFAGMARLLPALPVMGVPLLPKIIFGGKFGFQFDWFGSGGCKFQPVYVGDVARAMLNSIDDQTARGETYELGGPSVYSFKELMELVLTCTERKNFLLPIPSIVASFQALIFQLLPTPLLTTDQVYLLKRDNVLSGNARGLESLDVDATPVEAILPTYLHRFRRFPHRKTGA